MRASARGSKPLNTQKAYSKDLAEKYDRRHFGGASGQHILERDCTALESMLPAPPALVLDIPCGTGIYSAQFSGKGLDMVAADASMPMLAITGQRQADTARVQCSISELAFADDTFDAVMTVRLFSHYPREAIVQMLLELRRVTRPGGRLIFDTFRWTPRRWPLLRHVLQARYIDVFSDQEVRQMIERVGLRVVAVHSGYLFSPIWQRKLPLRIVRGLTGLEKLLPQRWLVRAFWACTKDPDPIP